MIQYPDFTGFTVNEAQAILASEYPDVQYCIINYYPPRLMDPVTDSSICRIIRQRITGGNLEFTVSPFHYNE